MAVWSGVNVEHGPKIETESHSMVEDPGLMDNDAHTKYIINTLNAFIRFSDRCAQKGK